MIDQSIEGKPANVSPRLKVSWIDPKVYKALANGTKAEGETDLSPKAEMKANINILYIVSFG